MIVTKRLMITGNGGGVIPPLTPLIYAAYYSQTTEDTATGPVNTFHVMNLTSIAEVNNSADIQHNGNGEFEYIGLDTKVFIGWVYATGASSVAAAPNFSMTMGIDTGSGYAPIEIDRSSLTEIGTSQALMPWCRYTVTLNTGDKLRPMMKEIIAGDTWRNFTVDHTIEECI